MRRLDVLLMVVLTFLASEALACDCFEPPGVEDSLRSHHSVFVGTVTAIDRKAPLYLYEGPVLGAVNVWFGPRLDLGGRDRGFRVAFAVEEGFKGAARGETVFVGTGFGGGDCGYDFLIGTSYLVYAWESEREGVTVGICSRTGPVRSRADDLRILRQPQT